MFVKSCLHSNACEKLFTLRSTMCLLKLECTNYFFRRFSIFNLRQAHIVYRLLDAALIGIFSAIPSYFEIQILAIREQLLVTLHSKGLMPCMNIIKT